ncbi:MAG: hypothetical protein HFJ91_07265 [Muribaculaceae bacterium]|nr:hypothetical protein [Muribaculaceae bacterium]
MNRLFVSLALAASLCTSLPLCAAETETATQAQRPFYGFYITNADFGADYGFAKDNFTFSEAPELILNYANLNGASVYAGAAVDGIYYVAQYRYVSSMEQPRPIDLASYNIYNGRLTNIGPWNPEGNDFKPQDMTYDYVSQKMYAIGFDGQTGLYEVDLTTGAFTKKCTYKDQIFATLAAAPDGKLYAISLDGWLYNINTTGRTRKVMDTGLSGFVSMQSMEFDRTNGLLYWASYATDQEGASPDEIAMLKSDVYMREIDVDKKTMNMVGQIGSTARFVALYIPSAASFDAPAASTDIKAVTTDPNVLDATISWTCPTETFGGGELTSLNGVVLFRDGEQIAFFDAATPGEKMSYVDKTIPAAGEYRYDIVALGDAGDGEKGSAFVYVGKDAPGAPRDLAVEVGADFLSASISWQAPVSGAHDGAFDPAEVTYKVTRRPDNLVVADGIKETSFVDKTFRRLLSYYYDVEAVNNVGATNASTPAYIIGPAEELPYEEDFEDATLIPNRWTTVDGNNDTYTWLFSTNLGHDVFGDYEMCAEFIISPLAVTGALKDADEWLITPPLKFDPAKKYEVVITARDQTSDKLEFAFGPKAAPEGMVKFGECTVTLPGLNQTTGSVDFDKFSAEIPTGDATIGCVGIHLVSPVPSDLISYLQIGTVTVREKDESGITDAIIGGANDAPVEYFNLQGVRVDNPTPGNVYIRRQGEDVKKIVL